MAIEISSLTGRLISAPPVGRFGLTHAYGPGRGIGAADHQQGQQHGPSPAANAGSMQTKRAPGRFGKSVTRDDEEHDQQGGERSEHADEQNTLTQR